MGKRTALRPTCNRGQCGARNKAGNPEQASEAGGEQLFSEIQKKRRAKKKKDWDTKLLMCKHQKIVAEPKRGGGGWG